MARRDLVPSVAALVIVSFLAVSPGLAQETKDKPAAEAPKPPNDPAAVAVVQKMIDAMGGADAWQKTGAMRFSWNYTSKDTLRASRVHWWNRMTGDYRIQGKNRQGETYVLLFNTQTKDGSAWVNGKLQEGEDKDKYMKRAYGLFINDTYWFLMPAKLFDPGVHLQMDGEATVNGNPTDRVKVTFDNVGLTPGDTYWAYIDRNTHLMDRWGMILQGDREKPGAKEEMYDWTGWEKMGSIMVSPERKALDDPDNAVIEMKDLQVVDSFPPEVFTNHDPLPM